ncbi:hypothetical protein LPJ61_003621, partial [Coemansia biformis]
VTSIGPSELNIEGIPLIGRLVVSSRGCIYLQDDTGQIQAFPTAAACTEQAPATQLDTASTPHAFAGQSLIGHVCVWRSWRLVVEDVSAASTVPDGGILPKERVPFSLAYVRLANPLAVYVDGSFGGSTSSQSPDERNASSPEAPAARPRRDPARHFLLFAHAQGLAMPQPGVSPDDTGAPTTDCAEAGWGALTIVKGAGLALASDSPSLEPLHGGNGCRDIETLDIGNVGKRDLRAIHVRCKFDTTPVCFASGAAYIVCVGDPVRCREFGASLGAAADSLSSVILLDLEREDHVHPVRVVSQQPGLADCAALSGGVPTETGLRAVAACLPVVRLNFASEDARRQIQPPTALSVSDLVDSAAAASGADRIVSVSGTILQREVTKAVTFCAARRADTALGDAAPAVVGQLENRITLQDNQDGTRTVAVYVKLSTFSHPLGLVPGARVVFRDVVVSVSKSTGNPYLIYAAPSLAGCRLAMHCYVDSVESLKLAMRCTACMRIVVDMGCACARKQHRAAGSGGGERAATMRAEAELLCLASDGSGIAWLSVSREDDVACVLGLQAAELAELCDAAAQAWNGQLLWRRQARDAEDAQASGASGIVAGAAATAAGARVLIEGAVGSGGGGGGDAPGLELPVRRQPLRMDGRGVVVNKRAPPTVVAARGKIFQPSTKIRLTNVSIVRLRKGGKRFELACYKNKVSEWRSGVEKDIDEVLQIHQVYMNVSKGQVAKSDVLQECFGTDNVDEVISEILQSGEQQVSDKERHHQLDNMFRDIATVVVEMCINPSTQQPYTVTMVEKAMSDIHYSVNTNRSAKQQALDVIRQLQDNGAFPIARARMRIRIVLPAKDGKRLRPAILEIVASVEDEERGEEHEYICLVEPGKYRAITELVGSETRGAGEVVIINFMDTRDEDDAPM